MVLTLALYAALALVVVGAVLYVVGAYNQVVSFARDVDRSFANVEVSLKQRHDEIPRLVETCRGYLGHEKGLLDAVTSIRNRFLESTDVDTKVIADNALAENLPRLFALAEDYPPLKANELFLNVQTRLTELENEIADRRELFNASVAGYNTIIESFPLLLLARLFGWRSRPTLTLGVAAS